MSTENACSRRMLTIHDLRGRSDLRLAKSVHMKGLDGVSKGSRVKVGTHMITVEAIHGRSLIISVDGGPPVHVTEQEQQLVPNVKVFVGVGATGNSNRLAFIAPKEIAIHRIEHGVE